ncbi:phage tail protein [Caldalkalibacillus salinus]|uniref:phage tail protein n=1 Tax=Caldalkalibacillus salinus TaxID=2803787 RepID=UPI001921C5D1|nr:tail fiber protein [Caldalkalibacillus salinus]
MDQMLGEIRLFPYLYAPREWTICNGQLLSLSNNTALFSLLGNKFGGDGHNTFALPDLQGAEPHPEVRYYIALNGIYPPRD